jgi:lipooligosaccharide transport system ATP-binding protein
MDEAEQLCDRLVIMDRGKIAEEGSPLELIRRLSTREVVELRFPEEVPDVGPETFNGRVARVETLPDRLLLYTDDGDALVPVAHELLQPQSVLVRRSTLEDVFLRLTGRTLVD